MKQSYQEAQESIVRQALEIVQTYTSSMLTAAQWIATFDVFSTLAIVAVKYDWICPQLTDTTIDPMADPKALQITEMRHPLLEDRIGSIELVRNDVRISSQHYACIISGPNMGGKGTIHFERLIRNGIIFFIGGREIHLLTLYRLNDNLDSNWKLCSSKNSPTSCL